VRRLALLFAAGGALAAVRAAAAQEAAYRFEITQVNDTTFSFEIGRHRWVAPRQRGIAVDPQRRDALVAQFEVLRVVEGVATAVVTGQATRVSTDHVALLERPQARWYRRGAFWIGAVVGLLIGGAVGVAVGQS
jgi:hypothetical protein